MLASEYISAAVALIEQQSSPWRSELSTQLRHLVWAAHYHEAFVGGDKRNPAPPVVSDSSLPAPSVPNEALEALEGGG